MLILYVQVGSIGTLVPNPTLQITVKISMITAVGIIPIHSKTFALTFLTSMDTNAKANIIIAQRTTVKNTFKKNLPKI
jgi:hypothetical protein